MPGLLLGTSITGRGNAAGREAAAQVSLAAVHDDGVAQCVNLAFADEPPPAGRCEVLPVLRLDAPSLIGAKGPRKPIVSEMLDALAAEASSRGLDRIGLVNGDIRVTFEAVERAVRTTVPAVAFSRTDDGAGEPPVPLLYGVDMFTFRADVWRTERRRFRSYVFGDAVWDNVYAAISCCLGGILLNREPLILHERHRPAFHDSPYASYIHLLAARDSSYFSLWCQYVDRAKALRDAGGSQADEEAVQREVFHAPGVTAAVMDLARATWWRARRAAGA